jgi:tetrahydrodipicolinate N-succinyltransferase
MQRYEIINQFITFEGDKLAQIRALIDFVNPVWGKIKAGTLGGFIRSSENLSQNGTAWVCYSCDIIKTTPRVLYGLVADNAVVGGNAIVRVNAKIADNAQVLENATINGEAIIRGNAIVKGMTMIGGLITIKTGVYDGNISISQSGIIS